MNVLSIYSPMFLTPFGLRDLAINDSPLNIAEQLALVVRTILFLIMQSISADFDLSIFISDAQKKAGSGIDISYWHNSSKSALFAVKQ